MPNPPPTHQHSLSRYMCVYVYMFLRPLYVFAFLRTFYISMFLFSCDRSTFLRTLLCFGFFREAIFRTRRIPSKRSFPNPPLPSIATARQQAGVIRSGARPLIAPRVDDCQGLLVWEERAERLVHAPVRLLTNHRTISATHAARAYFEAALLMTTEAARRPHPRRPGTWSSSRTHSLFPLELQTT